MATVKIAYAVVCCCVLVLAIGATGSSAVRVPQSNIDAVNTRWKSLGVKLPEGGIVLAEPFNPPYSNKSFVVPPEWFWEVAIEHRDHPDHTLSAAAMREDLPTLRFLLEKVYIGYKPAQDRGWDWDAFFRSWDDTLARDGDSHISLHDALAPWGQFVDINPDGHTGPYITGFHDFDPGDTVTAQLVSAPAGACTTLHLKNGGSLALPAADARLQPHAVHAWDGARLIPAWYVNYLNRSGEAVSIDCGGANVALQTAAQVRQDTVEPGYRSLAHGIGYIRTPFFFDYANDRAFRDALSEAHGLGKENVLLFDLRGNGGGAAPSDILTHWFSQKEIAKAPPVTGYSTTDSCFKNALLFNMFQYLSYTLKPPLTPDVRAWMQRGADSIGPTPAVGCDVKQVGHQGASPPSQTPFTEGRSNKKKTRVIVLIDGGCGSDCGVLVYMLSRLPNTVVAGTSMYGSQGGPGTAVPGLLVLPHTHIPFLMGTEQLDDAGEIVVDVLLPTAKSQEMNSIVSFAKALSR
jgi:hypothetical protein